MSRVSVATIDSGVNPRHPHVQPIAGGIEITEDGLSDNFIDVLGHGTAVAGAIREKAPDVDIFAVKVFQHALATSGTTLLRALDWCLDQQINFINLSLGTLNEKYRPAFEERVRRATDIGVQIVGAFEMHAQPALPGSLPNVVGVVLDESCPRTTYRKQHRNDRILYAACGYPRDMGVPPRYNLYGISFAVANVTGFLAAERSRC